MAHREITMIRNIFSFKSVIAMLKTEIDNIRKIRPVIRFVVAFTVFLNFLNFSYGQENSAKLISYGGCLGITTYLTSAKAARISSFARKNLIEEIYALFDVMRSQDGKLKTDCDVAAEFVVQRLVSMNVIKSAREIGELIDEKKKRQLILAARKKYCGAPEFSAYAHRQFCVTLDFESYRLFQREIASDFQSMFPNEAFSVTSPDREVETTDFLKCKAEAAQGSAAALRRCVISETNRHDVVLNEAYACLRQRLGQDAARALRDRQRNWIELTSNECAYVDQRGTIAADLRAGCRLGEVKLRALELAATARENGCDVPLAGLIEPDLNRWRNTAGQPSVSNAAKHRLEVLCGQSPKLFLSRAMSNTRPAMPYRIGRDVEIRVGVGKNAEPQQHRTGAISQNREGVTVAATLEMLASLKQGQSVEIRSGEVVETFALSGSTRAIGDCSVAPKSEQDLQKEIAQSKAQAAERRAAQLDLTPVMPSTSGVYIDLSGDIDLRIRCDRPFPEAYVESSGWFDSWFGQGFEIGQRFSIQVETRNGARVERVIAEVEDLVEGKGLRMTTGVLWAAAIGQKLHLEGSGNNALSLNLGVHVDALKRCHRANYDELQNYLIGSWLPVDGQRMKMMLAHNLMRTFLGASNFLGWPPVQPQAMHFQNAAGRIELLPWALSPNGNLHINSNSSICKIEPRSEGIGLTNVFGCGLKNTWVRVDP